MMNGVIYARYSSANQREESIEQQVEECTRFAERQGIRIINVYSDAAISGKTSKRPAFQRMLRDVGKPDRPFDVVVAYKSNRIGRNMIDALQYEDRMAKAGVQTIYAKEEFGDTAAGRFALRNMMNLNQFYSENLSEDVKRGIHDNAEKLKVVSRPPFGYKKSEDGYYVLDEERAPIAKYIFEAIADGQKYSDIIEELNRRGVKTPCGNDFNKGSFHRMLQNEMYKGVYDHCGVRVEGAVPALVSEWLWESVQITKKHFKRRKNENGEYLLSGKLFCGLCGDMMIGTGAKTVDGSPQYFYYTCRTARVHECEMKSVGRDWLETEVTRIAVEYVMSDEVVALMADEFMSFQEKADSPVAQLREERQQKQKALQNCISAVEQGLLSETIKIRIAELEKELRKLDDKIIREDRPKLSRDEIVATLQYFAGGNYQDKRYQKLIIDSFVKKVVLHPDRIEIDFHSGLSTGSIKVPCPAPFNTKSNFYMIGRIIHVEIPLKKGHP